MIPLLPFVLVVGGGVVYAHREKPNRSPWAGQMTAARALVLHHALTTPQSPEALRTLAASFRQEGLPHHAATLERRAALREQPKALYQARKDVVRRAMASTNPHAVRAVAEAHDQVGATGAAAMLREYAASLEASHPSAAVP